MNAVRALIDVWKKILDILQIKQKKQGIVVFLNLFVLSVLETFGVSLIVPFLSVLTQIDTIREGRYWKYVAVYLDDKSNFQIICMIVGAFAFFFVIKELYALFVNYLQLKYRVGIQKDLAVKMLYSYMRSPYIDFIELNSGQMMRGINSDTAGVYKTIDCLVQIASNSITSIFICGYLLYLSPKLTCIAMVGMATIVGIISYAFKEPMRIAGIKLRNSTAKTNQSALESLNSMKEIAVSGKTDYFCEKYEKDYSELEKATIVSGFIPGCPTRIIESTFIISILLCVVLVFGNDGIKMIQATPIMGAFGVAMIKVIPSLAVVSSNLTHIVSLRPALNSAHENFKKYRYIIDNLNKEQINCGILEEHNVSEDASLLVQNVIWKYRNSNKNVLDGVSLEINYGESIAIIGESGAGKTTLADVILGILKPSVGCITYNGINIYEHLQWWSRQIGYVPQSIYLMDTTIRNNVAFGEKNVDDNKVWEALEKAKLKDYVDATPSGLDTIVGERGVKMSGGQRQRIAIARALYNDPKILVLDEATSALDSETEQAIMESIESLQGEKTIIIIAHRLSTIRKCDKIYEIKDGKIIQKKKSEVFLNM